LHQVGVSFDLQLYLSTEHHVGRMERRH
jgi:hypothetical protein